MRKLIVLILLISSTYAFSKEVEKDKSESVKGEQQQGQLVLQKPANQRPQIRLNGFALYAFDDNVDSYYSKTSFFDGKIKGGFEWGGGLEYMIHKDQSIEISYLRLDSEAPMTYYNNGSKFTV